LYNNVRLHSAIGYIAPRDKLEGRAQQIFGERDRKLAEARERRKLLRQADHERRSALRSAALPAIDFAAIRAAVTIAAVLQLLGFQSQSTRGAQQRGPCPLHGSTSGTSRCFSVNLDDHLFHCFKCGASGNALDLWAKAKRLSLYDAAIDLCAASHIEVPLLPTPHRNREEEPVPTQSENATMTSP
jgi:hypothetical protein